MSDLLECFGELLVEFLFAAPELLSSSPANLTDAELRRWHEQLREHALRSSPQKPLGIQ